MTESYVLVKVVGDPAALIPGPGCEVLSRWTRPDLDTMTDLLIDLDAGKAIPPDAPDWDEDEGEDESTPLEPSEATSRPVVVVPAPVRTVVGRSCPRCGGALVTNGNVEWCRDQGKGPGFACSHGWDWPAKFGGDATPVVVVPWPAPPACFNCGSTAGRCCEYGPVTGGEG